MTDVNTARVARLHGRRIFALEQKSTGIIDRPLSTSFPWDLFPFGFSSSGAVVTLKGGEAIWGINPVATLKDSNITIAVDYSYVGIAFSSLTKELTAIGPSADISNFRPDADVWREWCFQFRLLSGFVILHRPGRVAGNLQIPAWWGK